MPLFEEFNQPNSNQNANQSSSPNQKPETANCEFGKQNPTQNNQKPSGLMTVIANLLPLAPLVFEQFTGQKVPQISGTMAEMKMAWFNIQSGMQTIINNQQQLAQRLTALEQNANRHLTNLIHQFNSPI